MKKGVVGAILIVAVIVVVLLVTGPLGGLLGGLLKGGSSFTGNFTTSPGGSNQTVQFNATVAGGSAPFRFIWSFGDGYFSTLQNPKHTFVPGSYTVELIVLDSTDASVTVRKPITVSARDIILKELAA